MKTVLLHASLSDIVWHKKKFWNFNNLVVIIMLKCLLTEFGGAYWENIWLLFMTQTSLCSWPQAKCIFPTSFSHSVNWYKVWTLGIEPSWYYKFSLKVAQNGFLIFKNLFFDELELPFNNVFFSNDAKNNAQLFLNVVEIIFLTIMVPIATTQIPKTL